MSNLLSRSGTLARQLPLGPRAEVQSVLELRRGDSLYRRGDPGTEVYRVEAGLLKLFVDTAGGRERIMALAGPGDLVGSAVRAAETRSENVEALSGSVRVSSLAATGDSDTELRLAATGWHLQQLRDTLEDAELPVPARLARTFVRLADRFGQEGSGGSVRLTLPLTHDNLAAMVGAARETTSFVLAEMRRAGVLAGTRGVYTFSPASMREYAVQNTVA